MGIIVSTNDCQILPASFMELLARALMVDSEGNVLGINMIIDTDERDCDCVPFINCDNNHLTPEQVLVNAFDVDACGNVALKLINCDGTVVLDAPEIQ